MEIGVIGVYLLEVSIFMLMLYVFNKWLLGRETLHHFNRYLWLATIVGSFLLPIYMGGDVVIINTEPIEIQESSQGISSSSEVEVVGPGLWSIDLVVKILFGIYICGCFLLIMRNILLYSSLFRMLWSSPYNLTRSNDEKDLRVLSQFREYEHQLDIRSKIEYIIHDYKLPPFSWFGYVVVSRSDIEDSAQEIILHELSHVKQLHSLDLILANVTTIILWFNPASWLVKRALQQVHEYCADDSVLQRGVNAKKYQLLLIKKGVGSRLQSISNTLNHSNLKNRITMMLKKKSPKMAMAKCLYAIPLLFMLFSLFSLPTVAQSVGTISDVKVTNNSENKAALVTKNDTTDEQPFLFADVMPKFNGGDLSKFRIWCMGSIRYPESAARDTIQGRAIASFWVMKDGSVDNIEILKAPCDDIATELVRVLKSSPKWTPAYQNGEAVALKFTIPVEIAIKE